MIIDDEEIIYTAPAYQGSVFLVMWQSSKSGGTYSTVRKSVQSLNSFLRTLDDYGFDMSLVSVVEQQKPWVLQKKKELTPEQRKKKRLEARNKIGMENRYE